MMQYFSMLICAVAFVLSKRKYRKIINPVSTFSVLWLIVVFLSNMTLYGMNMPSPKAYTLVFIGILSFLLGCSLSNRIKLDLGNETTYCKEYSFNYPVLFVLLAITLVVFSLEGSAAIRFLLSGNSLKDIRGLYASGTSAYSNNNVYYSIIKTYVAGPIAYALPAIGAIALFKKERHYKLLFAVSILIIFLNIVSEGGRAILINWTFCIIIAHDCLSQDNLLSKITHKSKRRIRFFVVLIVLILVTLSFMRGIDDVYRSVYLYFAGCITYLDKFILIVDNNGYFTFGTSSFYGLFSFVNWLMTTFGLHSSFLSAASTYIKQIQEGIVIGRSIEYNAFVTTFFQGYADGGYIGVSFFLFIWGYLSNVSFKKAFYNTNIKNVYLYSLIFIGIAFSFVRFPFVKANYSFAFLYAMILFKRVYRYGKNNCESE